MFLAIGIVGSSAYDTNRQAKLRRGESMTVRGYTLTYRELVERQAANAREVRAVVDVHSGGHLVGTLRAGKNFYTVENQISNEVAIRSNWKTGEDLFLIADQIQPNGTVYFKALVKPLVNLIWLAGFVFLGGAVIALWPDAREQRRLVSRYGALPAEA